MELSQALLITSVLAGLLGWCILPFVRPFLWILDLREGQDVDFGRQVSLMLAVPAAWLYAVFTVCLLYCK
jgi:hypothetical protein